MAYLEQKKTENEVALPLCADRIKEIDAIQDSTQKWTELLRGVYIRLGCPGSYKYYIKRQNI